MNKEYNDRDIEVAKICKALGHPARVTILRFLAEQETCFFGDIHDVLPIAKATVSQHLSELKDADLIQGEVLTPKRKYCINKQMWTVAQSLMGEMFSSIKNSDQCCK